MEATKEWISLEFEKSCPKCNKIVRWKERIILFTTGYNFIGVCKCKKSNLRYLRYLAFNIPKEKNVEFAAEILRLSLSKDIDLSLLRDGGVLEIMKEHIKSNKKVKVG
ncbi:MAG: hypothetical protein KKF27_20685 [Gammaproteobacteria bacterium]|nr:hypothetical protein [Gammaproteobacteria bacterium]